MKKRSGLAVLVGILGVWLFSSGASAASYYIAPTGGSDTSGSGTLQPFATFTYAIAQTQPGDTLYVRGGTYNLNSTISISSSKNGTALLPYNMMAYNNEAAGPRFFREASGARGIQLNGNYWNIQGITVQNARDNGINIQGSNNVINQVRLTGNQDSGLQLSGSSTLHPSNNLILNTDSFANYDPQDHGENADGFAAKFRDIGHGKRVQRRQVVGKFGRRFRLLGSPLRRDRG